jgi:6-phosphogluconate dehydrogenase
VLEVSTSNAPLKNNNSDIAVIGLGVMGANLARNLAKNGYKVLVYNRTSTVTEEFSSRYTDNLFPVYSIEDLLANLKSPRKILLMVKAGVAVDAILDTLLPLLNKNDIIIDGGNAHFHDTVRREARCLGHSISFLGVGVSGGEEGALNGPSIMPGGPYEGWKEIAPMLEKISAKVINEACTTYIGSGGSGHFVKMVHNGIEYADMQLIAESYDILSRLGGLDGRALNETFSTWNKGPLSSFLIEITAQIFGKYDVDNTTLLVDKIADRAGQKGTGRWTVQVALELGVAIPTIAAAVDSRSISARKDLRQALQRSKLKQPYTKDQNNYSDITRMVHDALLAGKIIAYAQGFDLMASASAEWKWDLNFAEIAKIWRGGCIIRADFLDVIAEGFKNNPKVPLLLHEKLTELLLQTAPALSKIVAKATLSGISIPSLASASTYLNTVCAERLPLNLTQAQRDLFGAHTYERVDKEGVFHTEWT